MINEIIMQVIRSLFNWEHYYALESNFHQGIREFLGNDAISRPSFTHLQNDGWLNWSKLSVHCEVMYYLQNEFSTLISAITRQLSRHCWVSMINPLHPGCNFFGDCLQIWSSVFNFEGKFSIRFKPWSTKRTDKVTFTKLGKMMKLLIKKNNLAL